MEEMLRAMADTPTRSEMNREQTRAMQTMVTAMEPIRSLFTVSNMFRIALERERKKKFRGLSLSLVPLGLHPPLGRIIGSYLPPPSSRIPSL